MSTPDKTQYYKELSLNLKREGFITGPETNTGLLPVSLDGQHLCHVTESGGIRYQKDALPGEARTKSLDQVLEIARTTALYMGQMASAPLLTADSLNGDYRLQAVIRKGKSHYGCDVRLERRLGQLDLQRENWRAGAALLSLRGQLEVSEAARLSRYDQEHVCVPKICDCRRETCRYLAFLEDCNSGRYLFHIRNHNLLLADAIRRGSRRKPILPDACTLIVDEAHKLPETAHQMFGVPLTEENIRALTHHLRGEQFLLATEILGDSTKSLLRKLDRPPEGKSFGCYQRSLAAPERSLTVIRRQLHGLLTPAARRRIVCLAATDIVLSVWLLK